MARVGFVPANRGQINNLGLLPICRIIRNGQNLNIRYKTGTARPDDALAFDKVGPSGNPHLLNRPTAQTMRFMCQSARGDCPRFVARALALDLSSRYDATSDPRATPRIRRLSCN